ncbi:hypothetical protein ABZ356_15020 [Micromonospora zamorensis]|uniref:hypothetical protein n=1 Tax=Micromonospora zamorensis TaxID=709883 RepID=UPI0033AF5A5B
MGDRSRVSTGGCANASSADTPDWPYVIASLEVPEALSGPCDLNGLDSDTQLRMIDRMLALIREFAEAD